MVPFGRISLKNFDVARILNRIADLLEFKDENPFKVRAYRRAAETITHLVEDVAGIMDRKGLRELPGVGESVGQKIEDICRTGTCEAYETLRKEVPAGLIAMTQIDGIGPKTAKQLWLSLGIDSLDKLEAAAREQRIRKVPGMGEKKELKILRGIEHKKTAGNRLPYYQARKLADPILAELRSHGFVAEVAGSLRRWNETVGDVDFLVAAREHAAATKHFLAAIGEGADILGSGETKTSVRLADGFRMDLRVIVPEDWGAALVYFTGSKAHNIRLRQIAIGLKYKLNEYGVWREKDDKKIAGATEEDVYDALGLPWVPPEIREDRGEIEWAIEGKLPDLIELEDIKGDLHSHTDASDGANTLDVLARTAMARGYEYLAVTDHTQSLTIAKGLDPARVATQVKAIGAWNRANAGDSFRVLTGTETDIHEDGSLDLPDSTLKNLDFVIASLHGQLRMPRAAMTARVCKALGHPSVDVMGHPSARLLGDREPVDFDFDEVLAAAKRGRTALEINASPNRMDLSADHCRRAKTAGVKVVISTDAHTLQDLENMPWGVHQARRGWIEKKDVLNALPREEFLAYCGRT